MEVSISSGMCRVVSRCLKAGAGCLVALQAAEPHFNTFDKQDVMMIQCRNESAPQLLWQSVKHMTGSSVSHDRQSTPLFALSC